MEGVDTPVKLAQKFPKGFGQGSNLKGTGTRDFIWLKAVSLDRSWLVGLMDIHEKNFKCCFIFLIIFFLSLVELAKIMPIANVNRSVFVN